jgi:hypothetical protein
MQQRQSETFPEGEEIRFEVNATFDGIRQKTDSIVSANESRISSVLTLRIRTVTSKK